MCSTDIDVNQCSLRGSTFCFCLLRLGLAVTGAPAEHFGTRIHGVPWPQPSAYGPPPPLRPPTRRTNAGFLHAVLATYARETERTRRHIVSPLSFKLLLLVHNSSMVIVWMDLTADSRRCVLAVVCTDRPRHGNRFGSTFVGMTPCLLPLP